MKSSSGCAPCAMSTSVGVGLRDTLSVIFVRQIRVCLNIHKFQRDQLRFFHHGLDGVDGLLRAVRDRLG